MYATLDLRILQAALARKADIDYLGLNYDDFDAVRIANDLRNREDFSLTGEPEHVSLRKG